MLVLNSQIDPLLMEVCCYICSDNIVKADELFFCLTLDILNLHRQSINPVIYFAFLGKGPRPVQLGKYM